MIGTLLNMRLGWDVAAYTSTSLTAVRCPATQPSVARRHLAAEKISPSRKPPKTLDIACVSGCFVGLSSSI